MFLTRLQAHHLTLHFSPSAGESTPRACWGSPASCVGVCWVRPDHMHGCAHTCHVDALLCLRPPGVICKGAWRQCGDGWQWWMVTGGQQGGHSCCLACPTKDSRLRHLCVCVNGTAVEGPSTGTYCCSLAHASGGTSSPLRHCSLPWVKSPKPSCWLPESPADPH